MPAGNYVNNTLDDSLHAHAYDCDPCEHWRNGPLLRKDSITARQLTYLTPQSVSLENRKIFIGDFSKGWVEANAQNWHDKIESLVDEQEAGRVSQEATTSGPDANARALRIADMELATAIAEETEASLQFHSKQQERRLKFSRLRRSRFRNHKLTKLEADAIVRDDFPGHNPSSQSVSGAARTSPMNPDSGIDKVQKPSSASSSLTSFYDCEESLKDQISDAGVSDLEDSYSERASTPASSLESCAQQDIKAPVVNVKRASPVPSELIDETDEAPRPLSHGALNSMKERHSHKLNHLIRHRKLKVPKVKLYQGKFLVQERRVRDGCTVESELDAPLATQLVTRWKEYAVLAQKTGDPLRPLVLYFYDCQDNAKLTRKAKRRWMKSLAFKVTLNPSYHVTIFSHLDCSLALWRPEAHRTRKAHRNHPVMEVLNTEDEPKDQNALGRFSFLLIHAQSLLEILHLAYLLTTATSGTPWTHGSELLKVAMPSADINLQVSYQRGSYGIEEELRKQKLDNQELIPYENLLFPIVSQSEIVHSMGKSMWLAVKDLPRRFAISREDETNKFALACTFNGLDHRPLWLTPLASASCSIPWIFWFFRSCASISLAQPKPKSNEITHMKEPPALEGYCSNMFTTNVVSGSSYSKPTFSTKRKYSLYLFTADNYLMCTTYQYAEPPMLAANQDQLEKIVEPYPLDSEGRHIEWIKNSTCLHEINYHDTIAWAELQRRKSLNVNARVLIDLIYMRSFKSNEKGDVEMRGMCEHAIIVSFDSKEVADCWARRLQEVSDYWRNWRKARNTKRAAGSMSDFSVSPMIQNRSIVYSGALFMKQHRFTSFKAYHVLLTTDFLLVFKIDQTKRPPALPAENTPSASYLYRHYKNIDLHDTYVYTGQVATHALLNDDNFVDPGNPGVRSLPRAFEDGRISQDSELDRCFVLWRVRKTRLPIVNSAGDGDYVTFLAQEKTERDKWATAIRYVQTEYVRVRRLKKDTSPNAATLDDELES